MYVRGGNSDENLYMVDGNSLYQVNHLGGLFSSFNVNAIDKVTFYKSSFPAKYGGRLSSVMNVQTKEGSMERYQGSLSLGLTSGNVYLEGPIVKHKTSFSVSLRRSWLEVLSIPGLEVINAKKKKDGHKTIANYSFTDFNLKLKHKFNERSCANMIVYYGSDYLKLGENEFSKYDDSKYSSEDLSKLNWGNMLAALSWDYKLNSKLSVETTVSYTHYASSLKQSVFEIWQNDNETDSEKNYLQKSLKNGIDDIGFRSDFKFSPSVSHRINFGVDYIWHAFWPENIKTISLDPSIQTDIINSKEQIYSKEFGVYLEDDWSLSSIFRVNGGLRFGNFNTRDKSHFTLEPRVSVRALILSDLSFKLSYSRMNQFVQQVSDSYISLPTDFWMPISKNFKPLKSDQISAGTYFMYEKKYSFSMEVYHKWMYNLLEYKDGHNLFPSSASWESKLTSGKGRSYGLDFIADKNFGKLKSQFGYGLMWSDRFFDEINLGQRFSSKYDNRHKLNVTANYTINKNTALSCSWMYVTGNKMTLSLENYQDLSSSGFPTNIAPSYPYPDGWGIDYYDKKNNVELPAYHRIDFGITIYRPKEKNRLGIWNISIYNAYCRMNPIVIQKSTLNSNSDGRKLKPLFQSLGIFPIIPSLSYTYKF